MKLPNDLIKATDYSKAKDREIHEFEYRNGKYIHKYVLGGEHELTPQEIIDCLNGLATIDCDLQTAYAFIQGQKEKISDLEAKLAKNKKWLASNQGFLENLKLKQQLSEKDQAIENWETMYKSVVQTCHNIPYIFIRSILAQYNYIVNTNLRPQSAGCGHLLADRRLPRRGSSSLDRCQSRSSGRRRRRE